LARIVSIERPPRKHYYDVTLDKGGVVRLSPEVLALTALRPGQEVSEGDLDGIRDREARYRAMTAALRLLAYRQRSERELRDALKRRSSPEAVIDATIEKLRSARFIDDAAFAQNYVEARDAASPRGKRLLAAELRARGVGKAECDLSLGGVEEADAAYRAAQKRARSLTTASYADFQRRLGDYLLRRGFSYEIARDAVKSAWAESHTGDLVAEPIDD
jgi:regulatory protein